MESGERVIRDSKRKEEKENEVRETETHIFFRTSLLTFTFRPD